MRPSDPKELIAAVIEAHGGESLWKELEALDAEVSASGFLFTAKRRPILNHSRMRAYTQVPHFIFYDFPITGQTSELIGDEEVIIKDADGAVIARREHPRSAFRGLRRAFSWDDLDFTYFGGYATWNYLVTPFMFFTPGFEFATLGPVEADRGSWSRIQVTFPDSIPTHCKTQVFYFDDELHLRRVDYTALVVGSWAKAAHFCDEYREFGGIKAPTRRRVTPILFGDKPLPGPTLVALDIHDIRPVPKQQ